MRKTIYNKYDKHLIRDLPQVSFPGRIEVITSKTEANKAVDFLFSQPLLGIDTETRPSFKKGKQNKVALLQISTKHVCFLFRLNIIGLMPSLIQLLEDETIKKVGLSLHDDIHSLTRLLVNSSTKLKIGSFVDLQNLVKEIGIEDMSLQKLYANFFHQKISKRQQLSNWESEVLTEKQKNYAAIDAWACINIYEEFNRLKQTGDYQLVIQEENIEENVQESISKER